MTNAPTFRSALVLLGAVAALLLTSLLAPRASANEEAPNESAGSWHQVHWHINAYRLTQGGRETSGSGRCSGSWRDDAGQCWGYAESRTWHDSYPFFSYTHVEWNATPKRCRDVPGGRDPAVWRHEVRIEAAHQGTGHGSWLCGWVDRGWNTMIVTGGNILGQDGRWHSVQASTGKQADRERVQGGPLYVFLDASRDMGAVIGFRGWIRY